MVWGCYWRQQEERMIGLWYEYCCYGTCSWRFVDVVVVVVVVEIRAGIHSIAWIVIC